MLRVSAAAEFSNCSVALNEVMIRSTISLRSRAPAHLDRQGRFRDAAYSNSRSSRRGERSSASRTVATAANLKALLGHPA